MNTVPKLKKSTSESGMNTYAGNFISLTGKCIIFGPVYNPQRDELKIENMKLLSAYVRHSINDVDYLIAEAVVAEGNRKEKFALLLPLATRVQAVSIALGLPKTALIHIREIVRKIRGTRAKPINIVPLLEGDELQKHISVSQRSFTEQIEHFTQLITVVSLQPLYNPVEKELTVEALNKLKDEMGIANDGAIKVNNELEEARMKRDKLLYAPKTGMMDIALAVKEYVKALFGGSSPEYKEVRHLRFRNRKI
ncbi:MAG: hypothetical protein LBS54_02090 [Dysgonamonadaceae bacterium]|jgi:hypothetical protein|nr:hypothetical protein [Dysgonamonadaceae bacterium]